MAGRESRSEQTIGSARVTAGNSIFRDGRSIISIFKAVLNSESCKFVTFLITSNHTTERSNLPIIPVRNQMDFHQELYFSCIGHTISLNDVIFLATQTIISFAAGPGLYPLLYGTSNNPFLSLPFIMIISKPFAV